MLSLILIGVVVYAICVYTTGNAVPTIDTCRNIVKPKPCALKAYGVGFNVVSKDSIKVDGDIYIYQGVILILDDNRNVVNIPVNYKGVMYNAYTKLVGYDDSLDAVKSTIDALRYMYHGSGYVSLPTSKYLYNNSTGMPVCVIDSVLDAPLGSIYVTDIVDGKFKILSWYDAWCLKNLDLA